MVKKICLLLTILTLLPACSKWWGEKQVTTGDVVVTSNEKACDSPFEIVSEDDLKSQKTYDCWRKELDQVWDQIEGSTPGQLTEGEVATVVRKRILKMDGPTEQNVRKALSAKRLLGFEGAVTQKKMTLLLNWLGTNRSEIRGLYHRLLLKKGWIRYGHLQSAAEILKSLSQLVDWKMSSETLGENILSVFQFDDPYLRRSIIPFSKMTNEFISMFCPTIKNEQFWNLNEIATCADRFLNTFSVTSEWVEFVINPIHVSPDQSVIQALLKVEPLMEKWFHQSELRSFEFKKWSDFLKSAGVDVTKDFDHSLQWIEKFKAQSTSKMLHPTAMLRLFKIVKKFQLGLFDGLPTFIREVNEQKCLGENSPSYWTECVIAADLANTDGVESLEYVQKVRNIRNGPHIKKYNGVTGVDFGYMMLFRALADEIILAFDDEPKDGLITANTHSNMDEVTDLIGSSLMFMDQVTRLFNNLSRRFSGLPLVNHSEVISFKQLNLRGLARLITLSSEVWVKRDPEKRFFIEPILSNITNIFPKGTVALDKDAIVAILTTVYFLPQFKDAYYEFDLGKTMDVKADKIYVNRDKVLESLPEILKRHFPRTYESCTRFGMEKSCLLVFNHALANPIEAMNGRAISAGELDLITIIGLAGEGLVDYCDSNHNGKLTWNVLDGADELDCTVTRAQELASRLFESKIIYAEKSETIDRLFTLVNSSLLTRVPAKLALIRGKKTGNVFRYPIFWTYNGATIGSIYGLLGSILGEPDRPNYLMDLKDQDETNDQAID